MTERVEAPRWLADHLLAFRASGAAPAVPRPAATVVLLRPLPARAPWSIAPSANREREERALASPAVASNRGSERGADRPRNVTDAGGFEVYVQRRAATMRFAPGYYAFPGGSVDPADHEPGGSFDADVLARIGLPAPEGEAVLRAAVREVAEEAGVRLDAAALAPWARWVTPEFEPRRFDTYFFVAPLPPGEAPQMAEGESDHAAWVTPEAALELPMLPPTRQTFDQLAALSSIDAVLAVAVNRELSVPVSPILEVDEDGVWMRLP